MSGVLALSDTAVVAAGTRANSLRVVNTNNGIPNRAVMA